METTEGYQPGPSGGERVLVAMAAIALVSGLLIVGGNLLPKEKAVSLVTPSPKPTASPSRTPLPTPAPLDLALESGSPVPPLEEANPIF